MISQIVIAFTGFVSIWLSQDTRESWRKWACVFGLAGEPFWFYVSYTSEQWGVFALAFLYTLAWVKGAWAYWLKPGNKLRIENEKLTTEYVKRRWYE